jgi:hypothetical protein
MFQKIRSGSTWIKQNRLFLIVAVLISLSLPFFLIGVSLFGLVASISADMLKALIEAQATILGFYGLIVIYALTSFDGRIDRLERQMFELNKEIRVMDLEDLKKYGSLEKYKDMTRILSNVEKLKRRTVGSALFNGILLIGSLLTSILGLGFLGIPDNPFGEVVFGLSVFSVMLFFFSIGLIFLMIYDLAKSPETT